jgi:hypothetical protein
MVLLRFPHSFDQGGIRPSDQCIGERQRGVTGHDSAPSQVSVHYPGLQRIAARERESAVLVEAAI